MLRRLKNYGVRLKLIKYLGKIISENGYRDSTINTEALEKLREPPTKKKKKGNLRRLLGFLGYFKQSICDFSRDANPLYDILCVPPENTLSNLKHRSKKTKGQRSSNEKIDFKRENILS